MIRSDGTTGMTNMEMRAAGLTRYQVQQVRQFESEGWTVGPIERVGECFASIRIRKEGYDSMAGFAVSKTVERDALGRI